jgi:hypothetical protein
MATNYKITFKNHCTPQEYVTENTRWYLDSDVGTRLSGGADAGITVTTQPVYSASTTVAANAASPVSIGATTQDFVFIKNLGLTSAGVVSTADVYISLDATGGKYRIKIAPGESFAAEIGTASAGSEVNSVFMKTGSGEAEQTVQTLRGT